MQFKIPIILASLFAGIALAGPSMTVQVDGDDCYIEADGLPGCTDDNKSSDPFTTVSGDSDCSQMEGIGQRTVDVCGSGVAVSSLGGLAFHESDTIEWDCDVESMTAGESCTPTPRTIG